MDSSNNKPFFKLNRSKKFWSFLGLRKIFLIKHKRNVNGNGRVRGKQQIDFDKKLVFSLAKSRIPNLTQLKYIKKYLNPGERWLLRLSFIFIIISLLFISVRFYTNNLKLIAVAGGTYSEGLIGAPKYINPLYANISDVDHDISQLLYSSLFKRNGSGELVQDLVENYQISEDNKIYIFQIRPGVKWHDDTLLTVDDIIFTFNAIKDSQYKSSLRAGFIGVEIEKIDDQSFKFILSNPYAAFLELLTFGILPAKYWYQIPPESASLAELNLKPIGSGLYKFDQFIKDKAGHIKEYNLKINEDYYREPPFINITYKFFPNFTEAIAALNDSNIDGISYLPQEFRGDLITPKAYHFHKLYLPQLTVIFFNQANNPALADKNVRQALALAVDRDKIINDILAGDAYVVNSPILPNSFAYYNDIQVYDFNLGQAKELLEKAGWQSVEITADDITQAEADAASEDESVRNKAALILDLGQGSWRRKDNNYLTIILTTIERNENEDIVRAVQGYWQKIGVKTKIAVLPASQMQAEIIKPRDFEALFYGQVVGADPDLYAFWHSSQIGANGFNLANYANEEVDQLLEEARLISDIDKRKEKYRKFQEIIAEEEPAIFMFSPTYTYIQSNKLKGFNVSNILYPSDRFANINEWYLKTGKKLIWPND